MIIEICASKADKKFAFITAIVLLVKVRSSSLYGGKRITVKSVVLHLTQLLP